MKKFFFISTLFFLFSSQSFEKENVKITTDDGWILNAIWQKPASSENYTFLFIHSQKNNLNEWNNFFPLLKKYGLGYLAIDLRGHGLSINTIYNTTSTFKSFSIKGFDNEYNKMIRDIDSAIVFISSNGVSENKIIPIGSWLGANLAIKIAAINQNLPMSIAIFPSMNINDVLIVNPLRAYGKKPLLLITSPDLEKKYKEFQLLNDIAKFSSGKENVFSLVIPYLKNASSIKKYDIRKIIEWTMHPSLPEVINYDINKSTFIINESSYTFENNIDDGVINE